MGLATRIRATFRGGECGRGNATAYRGRRWYLLGSLRDPLVGRRSVRGSLVWAEPVIGDMPQQLVAERMDSAHQRLRRGDRLIERCLIRRSELKSADSQRHLYEGFNRRMLMLEAGRHEIEEITGSAREGPISVYQVTDLSLHLNAYYLNLCGALDNLAWALQHEYQVLGTVTEKSGKRMQCVLFGREFRAAIQARWSSLEAVLSSRVAWYNELRDLRDPGAHRIPIYAIPGLMTEAQAVQYNRLQAFSSEAARSGDLRRMMELQHEAYSLATYAPWMSLSSEDGYRFVNVREQVLADYDQLVEVAEQVLDVILPMIAPAA